MELIVVGVIILIVVLLAPIFVSVISWAFNNLAIVAVIIIVIGIIKIVLDSLLFEKDENDNYIVKENGKKKFKELGEIIAGFAVSIFLVGIVIFFIWGRFW